MSLDAHGLSLDVGVDYLLGGRLRFDSAGRATVELADGRSVQVDPAAIAQVVKSAANPAIADQAMGTHRITGLGDPVGLQDAATAAWCIAGFMLLAQNGADIPSPATFRGNLELGGAALLNVGATAGTVAAGDDVRLLPVTQWPGLFLRRLIDPVLGTTGWTTSAVGSGTGWYVNSPQYSSSQRVATVAMALAFAAGSTASGTNARIARQSATAGLWLADGFRMLARMWADSPTGFETFRLGLWANAETPVETGRPASGVWLEYDPATHGNSNLWACCANGSTVTVADTGVAFDGTQRVWVVEYESTSSCKIWELVTSSTVARATLTTNLPSGNTQRTATAFGQLLRANAGPTTGKVLMPDLGVLLADDGMLYALPA